MFVKVTNYFWQQLRAEDCFRSSSFNQVLEFKGSELGNILIHAKRWILKASFCTCSWTRFCESSVYNMSLASLAGIMAKSSTCFCSRWRFLRSRRKMRADRDPNLMNENVWLSLIGQQLVYAHLKSHTLTSPVQQTQAWPEPDWPELCADLWGELRKASTSRFMN